MGAYTITDTITESGKSTVYRAIDDTGRIIAVKHLRGNHAVYDQLRTIHHPFLPDIYNVSTSEDETVVEEEWIEGASIGDAALKETQIRRAILELCQVLAFLHKQGIIHRDIKPSNLLIAPDGHIRLIDFDASRTVKEDQMGDTQLLGTQGYAPPEQYGFAQTDKRTDVYAVGITMRTLLGPLSRKRRNKKIIKKCTALDPKRRYPSVERLRLALYKGRAWRWVVRPLLWVLLAAIAAFTALIIYALSVLPDAGVEIAQYYELSKDSMRIPIVRDRVFASVDMPFPPRPFSIGNANVDRETRSITNFVFAPVQPRVWRSNGVGSMYDALFAWAPEYYYIYVDTGATQLHTFGKFKGEFDPRVGRVIYQSFEGLVVVDGYSAAISKEIPNTDCAQYPDEMAKLYWMDVFDTPFF